ncbi:MAG: MFS transporter [Dehalococcoidia bacterium]|jgi:sugar (glycoside-pentoside-hexuronide) transporter
MGSTTQGTTNKLSFGLKLGYSSGAFGQEFVYSTIGFFLMYFFTDVALIGAALAGIMLTISRLWDAFADLLMGYISDHTKSRWGQRRPYVLFGAIPLGILFFLVFQTPSLPPMERTIYYGVIIFLVWSAFSVVTVSYNAMVPNITRDPKERASLVGVRQVLVIIALIVIGGVTKPIVALFPTQQIGWGNVALLFAILVVVTQVITFFSTRETYSAEKVTGYNLKDSYKMVWQNKPFVMLCVALLLLYTVTVMASSVLNYFCKYNLQNEGFISIALISMFGLSALLLPLWVLISNKIGKKMVYILGLAIFGCGFLWMFFMNGSDIVTWLPVFILLGIGFSAAMLSIFSIVAETIEYGEWKLGVRTEGILYGVYIFTMKLAASVAMLIIGFGLEWAGYVPNVVQTQTALNGIRTLSTIVPFAILIAGAIIMCFYPLDEKKHAMIVKEIEERKQTTKA